jgi:hypothetical protein
MVTRVLPLREEALIVVDHAELSVDKHSHIWISIQLTFG